MFDSVAQRINKNFMHGLAEMQKGSYQEATRSFSLAIEEEPDNEDFYIERGKAFLSSGDIDNAIIDFEKANDIKAEVASVFLARSYALRNNPEKALDYLSRHLESRYRLPESELRLDKALQKLENDKRWLELWRKKHYHRTEEIVAEMRYLVNSRDYLEALDFASRNIDRESRKHELFALRAAAYMALNNYKNALKDYSRAIKITKREPTYFESRAKVYSILKKYGKATNDYTKALKIDPYRFECYLKRATVYRLDGNYNKAIEDIEEYQVFFPESKKAAFEAGRIYHGAGEFTKAIENFDMLIDQDKSNPDYFYFRGLSHFQKRNFQNAFYDFSQTLDLDPNSKEGWFQRGQVNFYQGNRKQACSNWQKAANLGHPGAVDNLRIYCRH